MAVVKAERQGTRENASSDEHAPNRVAAGVGGLRASSSS